MIRDEGNILLQSLRWPAFEVIPLLPSDFGEVVLVALPENVILEADGVILLSTDFVEIVHIELDE